MMQAKKLIEVGMPVKELPAESVRDKNIITGLPVVHQWWAGRNQETAIKEKEPLKTLAEYRMTNNKVLFGQNVLCGGEGVIRVGDEIKPVKTKPSLIN